MESITIPSSVKNLGRGAFGGCENLITITFGKNSLLEAIEDSTFSYCVKLESITIPSGVEKIGGVLFESCDNLTSVIFEDTSTWYYTAVEEHNYTGGTEISVNTPSDNATYLKDTYCNMSWYKI